MMGTILMFVAAALQGADQPQVVAPDFGEAYYLFLQGRTLEAGGDLTGAVAAYRRAVDLAPEAAEIRAELAGLYARQGRALEAIAEAEAALRSDPDSREAHRILGFVKTAMAESGAGRAEPEALRTEAIGHFERALAGRARDLAVELALGRLHVRQGQHAEAIARLTRFLLDQPDYPEAMQLLAEAYEGNGQPAEAAAVLAGFVTQAPDQVRARTWLAELYERAREWPKAIAIWRDLGRSGSRATLYRIREATALVNSGDLEAGRHALVQVTQDAPDSVSGWYLLSQVERRAGDADAAERAARQVVSLAPDDARGPLALAEAHAARGNFRLVVETLEPRVTDPRPSDLEGGSYARMAGELASALQALGEDGEAVRVLESAREQAPLDPQLLFELGAAYERDSRFDEAERAFRRIIEREPANADALNYLGYMLADRGEKLDEALVLIRRALAAGGDNPSYLDSLGWAHYRRGEFDSARDPLERAAAALPRTSVIQDHLGDLYLEIKRYRDAATAFRRALDGDRQGIDVDGVTRKLERARQLAGGR